LMERASLVVALTLYAAVIAAAGVLIVYWH
jgi:hypothetical protein